MTHTPIQTIGALLFAVALVHTFSTRVFEHLARVHPAHAGMWRLLGEVEVVFGWWAIVLAAVMFVTDGSDAVIAYVDTRNFTEPMFVFAIMVIAATRPILQAVTSAVTKLSRLVPSAGATGFHLVVLAGVPLLGSLITEPAAMTLAALMLSERIFCRQVSTRLKYIALGVLFVNVSIGGTLTPFAAPPVLMVAGKWQWDTAYMLSHFGWKAAMAVLINALGATLLSRAELSALPAEVAQLPTTPQGRAAAPLPLLIAHLIILTGVVALAHHPAMFMGLFLLFLGLTHAYDQHQDPLILREGLLVGLFLAGLVMLGGQQQWWLQPLLLNMSDDGVFLGAAVLTAITDNAALTYLGSLVEGLSDSFKYALVAGAVTGGGLTLIANAPNPAGAAILRGHFRDGAINPLFLLVAALPPTLVAGLVFRYL